MADDTDPPGERLQKVLARAGIGSRRASEILIDEGRVSVNGAIAHLGCRVQVASDVVEVDGVQITVRDGLVHYLMNKKAGVVTTASDPQGRPTVLDEFDSDPRVFPVGRLDMDTEGLLLITNDGDLTHRLTHPSFGVDKEYLVQLDSEMSRGALRSLRDGVELEDGMTAPAKAAQISPGVIRLTIHEGRNRQVRRMCEAVGHRVVRLVRTRIGPLVDTTLGPGEWRPLTRDELRSLERALSQSPIQ